MIGEALSPYDDDLTIVTKVGALRGDDASATRPVTERSDRAVHDNLRNLRLDVLEVVNLRAMFKVDGPAEGSIEAPLTTLAQLREQGLIKHIGLSNVTRAQIAEAQRIVPVSCVQNMYNIVQRQDDSLINELAAQGIAYVPFFPLGDSRPFSPLPCKTLRSSLAQRRCRSRSRGCLSVRRISC